ncbi:cysteine rich repeat-containing protein [Pseudorhodoplanes sp.]|uniref:cysteine rich repeat-containing protein n=1 Tax=Pseudorhodoplanes sp. TaxID=1934341 RepID=UPI002CC490CF|nr:cysteine rich repeat-containing protein [Pseudorhodoplanes sp.]HWV40263.1 cysteine rich repeat-containing protein [Pseudorhodoplanes sp.]
MKPWHGPMLAGFALLFASTLVHAQTPSKAQQDALRSNCRSDFMRNCSSVTPGGREALECLMQNKAKVSSGCQNALNVISAPAAAKPEPKAEPKPEPKAATPAKTEPAAAPAATAPTAPHTPSASAPATPAPTAPTAKKPAKPVKAAAPSRPQAAPPAPPAAAAPAPAAVTAAPPPPVTHQPKLGEAILIRRFCTIDFKVLCKGVQIGQGRAVQCLVNNAAALSPGCRQAMLQTGELSQ